MIDRRNQTAVTHARLERAIGRTLRTLPTLRIHGECISCGRTQHAATCTLATLELELMEHRGKISAKEVRHYLYRKPQGKTHVHR